MLRTPPQCLSLQNVNLLFYCNGNHVGNILTYYIHSNTLWNSILPLCQSSFYTVGMWRGGEVEGEGGMWWNTTFCPKRKLYANTHTDYKVSFLFFIYFFFKRTIQKKKRGKKERKTENTGVLCALMFWSSCVSLSLRLQTSWGSDFLRQFVSGNWSFQLQLSVSWELLRKKKRVFELFKMLMDPT